MTDDLKTTADLAREWRCSPRKIRKAAAELGVGVDFGGRAGYRYNAADVVAIWNSMKPVVVPQRRRRVS